MRNVGTNNEVLNAYARGRAGPNRNGTGSIFFEDKVIYSYGYHFPMAVKMDGFHLVNGDRYSVTTSGHQSGLQSALGYEGFTTSFSALEGAGLNPINLTILDKEKDKTIHFDIGQVKSLGPEYAGFTVLKYWYNDENKVDSIRTIHRAGTLLLLDETKTCARFVLCSMDEQSYFCSLLPGAVWSINDAFEMLKPDEIRKVEADGKIVYRQGEWFSYQVSDGKEARDTYAKLNNRFILPVEDQWSNYHTVTRGKQIAENIYWSGAMFHSEHKTLRVSRSKNPVIMKAVKNTSLGNWSASGVD